MPQRYLDPKNDIVFKRIFGEHPEILRSFLNALLPLEPDALIESLEYLPTEQVPQLPLLKNSIVDVRCRDAKGRQFIVEMQMNWTSAFLQRVLFNASKAYVHQLEKGEQYELLQPVIGLSLLDDIFDHKTPEFYHHYRMVNVVRPEHFIDGLQLVFVELPKFTNDSFEQGKASELKQAWLRFLRELGDVDTAEEAAVFQTEVASKAPEIQKAYELSGESGFTRGELAAYDRYWDIIRSERTLLSGSFKDGREEGLAEGEAIGRAKEREALRDQLRQEGIPEGVIEKLLG